MRLRVSTPSIRSSLCGLMLVTSARVPGPPEEALLFGTTSPPTALEETKLYCNRYWESHRTRLLPVFGVGHLQPSRLFTIGTGKHSGTWSLPKPEALPRSSESLSGFARASQKYALSRGVGTWTGSQWVKDGYVPIRPALPVLCRYHTMQPAKVP